MPANNLEESQTLFNQKKIAKFIREHKVVPSTIKKVKAREFQAETGIKAKKEDIQEMIRNEILRQKVIVVQRRNASIMTQKTRDTQGHFLWLLGQKTKNVERWEDLMKNAMPLKEGLSKKYQATWKEDFTFIKMADKLLLVRWNSESNWNQNYCNTVITNRRIELYKLENFNYNFLKLLGTSETEGFRGNFLTKAIAELLKIDESLADAIIKGKRKTIDKLLKNKPLTDLEQELALFSLAYAMDYFDENMEILQVFAKHMNIEEVFVKSAREKNTELMFAILENAKKLGVELGHKDNQGKSALDYATKHGIGKEYLKNLLTNNEKEIIAI